MAMAIGDATASLFSRLVKLDRVIRFVDSNYRICCCVRFHRRKRGVQRGRQRPAATEPRAGEGVERPPARGEGCVGGVGEVSPAVGRLVETAELRVSSCTVGANWRQSDGGGLASGG